MRLRFQREFLEGSVAELYGVSLQLFPEQTLKRVDIFRSLQTLGDQRFFYDPNLKWPFELDAFRPLQAKWSFYQNSVKVACLG